MKMEMAISQLILILSLFVRIDAAGDCNKKTSCSCESSDGIIDLSPLAAAEGTDPKFKDVQDEAGSYYFSWNPCNSFTEGTCTSVSGCQTDLASAYFSIGTEDSATFKNDATDGLYIQYTAITDVTRILNVYLKCDKSQEGSIDVKGEDPPGSATYKMTLSSKYACPVGSGGGGSEAGNLSAGSVIVIIFFALLIVYVAAGIVFQTFVRKAAGKERAPNYVFWSSLPGLIKDGVLFTVKCGKVGSSYDKI